MNRIARKRVPESANLHPPVLLTKLNIPHQPAHLISRDRLDDALAMALHCKLTLVTAPPGFGKSTLVSDWVRRNHIEAGWISLEAGENDVLRFWGYVIAAFDRLRLGTGRKALSLLQSPVAFSVEQMVAWLVNDLAVMDENIVMIMDDFHVIESQAVLSSFYAFLQRIPERIHMCVMSRKELPFPVAALRAKGELNQIGIDELKFTEFEISSFWTGQTGESADKASLSLLAARTEGWAAGIQLAALVRKKGQPETLRHFTGRHHYVADYLMEEVFQCQPESHRLFLMQTAVLERLNLALCRAVTGSDLEEDLLQQMERGGLFLIPLDGERYWYRYHHLFGEFLRSRLILQYPADVARLHSLACSWFEGQGYLEEAINHAFAAGDLTKAADLLEKIALELLRRWELTTLNRWLQQLTLTLQDRPNLLFFLTWTELFLGHYDKVKNRLAYMRAALTALTAVDKATFDRMEQEMIIIENFLVMLQGDFDRAMALIQILLEVEDLPDGEGLLVSIGIELNEGTIPFVRGYYGFRGRMKLAAQYHQVYHAFIEKNGLHRFAFSSYQRTAMSEVYYERNELAEAMAFAEQAMEVAQQLGITGAYVSSAISKARIAHGMEEPTVAIQTLRDAMKQLDELGQTETQWFEFLRAYLVRSQMAVGETEAVDLWLKRPQPNLDAEITINQDFEWLTWIRVLTASGRLQEALALSTRLLDSAKQNGRIMTELEAGLCLAILYDKLDRTYDCMLALQAALELGNREGYFRTFVDLPEVLKLLGKYAELRKSGYMPELLSSVPLPYVRDIISVAGDFPKKEVGNEAASAPIGTLTAREAEVLKLIAEGLSNKEIAVRLVLTEGTVKLHIHRIYGKLQAKGRVQAIQIARQSGLIGHLRIDTTPNGVIQ
ncbi:LuxR family transcriptional regulator, maltose regulon positive regulatory protein [Cohnella sp. OV330]|uniref:LuxR C-terminal-related transcriptional regulator n=1 Tax=Cohnella sp. OV330 TaxID=1855288 RepID=UPI0008EA45BD|nr:LuxR C-terminal-related transcriptional regulator [Cohnella sp. OV330]SFB44891.1 LuxR family transcriptional regulator, maltose regulon positive regulatory protein [Cohnella sp. OV330]